MICVFDSFIVFNVLSWRLSTFCQLYKRQALLLSTTTSTKRDYFHVGPYLFYATDSTNKQTYFIIMLCCDLVSFVYKSLLKPVVHCDEDLFFIVVQKQMTAALMLTVLNSSKLVN